MNDKLTTAYTIKKAVNQNWMGRNRRKEINISQMFYPINRRHARLKD